MRQMPIAQIHSAASHAPVNPDFGASMAPTASILMSACQVTSARLARFVSINRDRTIASVTLVTSRDDELIRRGSRALTLTNV